MKDKFIARCSPCKGKGTQSSVTAPQAIGVQVGTGKLVKMIGTVFRQEPCCICNGTGKLMYGRHHKPLELHRAFKRHRRYLKQERCKLKLISLIADYVHWGLDMGDGAAQSAIAVMRGGMLHIEHYETPVIGRNEDRDNITVTPETLNKLATVLTARPMPLPKTAAAYERDFKEWLDKP